MSDTIALPRTSTASRAIEGFLARYRGNTRKLYEIDLRIFTDWCASMGLDPLEATRSELELFARHLEMDRGNAPSTVAHRLGVLRIFYRLAVADERILRDPTTYLNVPRVHFDPAGVPWLDRYQMGRLQRVAAETSPAHAVLVMLMGGLGLRVSEACAIDIEDFRAHESGYNVLRIIGKGNKPATIPIPVPLQRFIDAAAGDRKSGPLIVTKRGRRQTRNGAYDWIKRLAKKAGVDERIHPHSLRHSAITAALETAGLRDAQIFARHSDSRSTGRYDRNTFDLDRHASHGVVRYMLT